MNKVHLVGDIGDKFGHEWNMNVSDYGEIIRLIDCQREGFKKYLIDSEENEVGFVIQRAGEYIDNEVELLLNLNDEDIIITAVPMGAGSDSDKGGFLGSGIGKVILGIVLIVIGYYLSTAVGEEVAGKFVSAAWAATVGGAMMTIGVNLLMQGVEQLLAGTVEKKKQEEGYLFDGGTNAIAQGQPVPLLYGELLIPGTPISSAMTNNYVPLTYLQYTDRDYSTSTSLYATNYTNAQNAGNTQAGGGGVTNTESYDQTYATEIE